MAPKTADTAATRLHWPHEEGHPTNLRSGWLSIDLPGRNCGSTYCFQATSSLPQLPASVGDDFSWLPDPGRRLEWAIGNSRPEREFDASTVDRLEAVASAADVRPPAALASFLRSPRRDWIRSFTGCWLELPDRIVSIPGTGSQAIRFLNDQQGVLFWYVAVAPEGEAGVVVSTDLFDSPEPWLETGEEAETYLCAPSLDAFLHRFWIENEIAFRSRDGVPLTSEQASYLERLRDVG